MDREIFLQEPWLGWAVELQSIAQCGLAYVKDVYDRERYERLREIAAEMLSYKTGLSEERVKDLFCGETGYQTPKLDTRAAVFREGKILLVHERGGNWSLPGGWVDVWESVGSNTMKEAWEEAGVKVAAERLAAVQDREKHNRPHYAQGICKIFVLCRYLEGEFRANSETTESGWFSLEDLPPLEESKTTQEQIALCFQAQADPNWQVPFD